MSQRGANYARLAAALLCAVPLMSCVASITSQHSSKSLSGLVYHLPTTKLTIATTYRLVDCGPPPKLVVESVDIENQVVADLRDSATFTIDNTAMSTMLKAVPTASVSFSDGLIKSVTYQPEDKTGDIIASLAGTVKKAVVAFGGGPISLAGLLQERAPESGPARPPKQVRPVCNADALQAVKVHRNLETAELALAAKRMELVQNWTTEIAPVAQEIDAESERLRAQMDHLTGSEDGFLTATVQTQWIVDPDGQKAKSIELPIAVFNKWFNADPANVELIRQAAKVEVTVEGPSQSFNAAVEPDRGGLYYRVPVDTTVVVDVGNIEDKKTIPMLQFGPVANILMENGLFQKNQFTLSFASNGEIESFQYVESLSRLSAAATAAGAIVGDVGSTEQERLEYETTILKAKQAKETERGKLLKLQQQNALPQLRPSTAASPATTDESSSGPGT